MGSLLKDVALCALGYGISEISKSHPVKDFVDNNVYKKKTLEDVIEEYARSRGIYTDNNDFAHSLHEIASKYEQYNYKEVYGDS
jgi:hypothetical protein